LHVAVQHGHEQVASDLIHAKSNLEANDLSNQTPLLMALNHNRGAIARMLVDKKANYEVEKVLLDQIFCGKIAAGQDIIAEIMLAHGVSPNCEVQGFTPLMIASLQGDQRLVDVLLKAGAKPNAKGKDGLTPLLAAVQSADLPTVKSLVEAGADIKAHNSKGATVTHVAAASGNVELLDYLLDHGAPLGEKTKSDATVLSAALLRDHRAAALELQKRGLGLDPKGAAFEAELEAVLRMDLAELLEPLMRSGWQANFALRINWPMRQVAKLFEAQRCLQLLGKGPDGEDGRFIKMASAKSMTKRPTLASAVTLEDPRPEEASLIPGNVDVDFVIDSEGNVVFPRISKVDDDRLREPTLQAIQRFKFRPAYAGSEPAALQVKQTLVWQRTIKRDFDIKDVDEPPVPLKQVSPTYPSDDKMAGRTGTVVVEFVIGVDGRVTDIEVIRSSRDSFASAVLYAVSQWRFRPGRKGGVPVNVRAMQKIPFSLGN
jgi:TonB family protein